MITQLHLHTEFSLLDGIITIPSLVAFAMDNKLPAVCVTDHGGIGAFPELYFECKKAGIKPIFGCEFYFYDIENFKKTYHIVLIAQNNTGLVNIIKLSSKSYDKQNFYKKPRINFDLLREHSEGLFCLTACPAGLIFDPTNGEKNLMLLYDIFGKNLYLELSNFNDNKLIIKYHNKYKIPYVITNDTHYLFVKDKRIHEIQLATVTRDSFSMAAYDLHYEAKYKVDRAIISKAEKNILSIIDKCNAELKMGKFMPKVNWLKEEEKDQYIKTIVDKKLRKINRRKDKDYIKRFKYEFDVIKKAGYLDYFIIVADYVNWARNQGIFVGWGRGSGAGSLLAYLTNITQIDPIKHNLIFERFINPERPSVPDIDVDFEDARRNEVKKYVTDKYGKQNVVQIGTYGTRGLKQSYRDVARALKISQSDINLILQAIDKGDRAITGTFARKYPELFEYGESLKGVKRNFSTHAAGVVISDKPLIGKLPLIYDETSGTYSTSWDMYVLEKMGFVKFDILGLRAMNTLHICEDLLRKHAKIETNMVNNEVLIYDNNMKENITPERKKVYKMLSQGKTSGVFEFEGWSAQQVCKQIKIDNFNDIVAANALARPGGRKQVDDYIKAKRQGVKYFHPLLEPILKDSRGILLYDDQVMRIVSELAGFDAIKVDEFRKTMKATAAKAIELYKGEDNAFVRYKSDFIKGCRKNNIPEKTAEQIYQQITSFDGYGFNKNHATAYSIISYVTAFMKVTVPEIYAYAYLMTAGEDNLDKLLHDLPQVKVINPDINKSEIAFSLDIKSKRILKGLCSVKGIGTKAAEVIIKNRPYKDFSDFLSKTKGGGLTKDAILNCINCGLFGPDKKGCIDFFNKFDRSKKVVKKKLKKRVSAKLF